MIRPPEMLRTIRGVPFVAIGFAITILFVVADQPVKAPDTIEEVGQGLFKIGLVKIDAGERTLSLPAELNMKDEVVEYLLVTGKGKTHESILTTKATAEHVHIAALLLGLNKKGGTKIDGSIEWQGNGKKIRKPLSQIFEIRPGVREDKERVRLTEKIWNYTGSLEVKGKGLAANLTGSLISLIEDPEALVTSLAPSRTNDDAHFASPEHLPPKLQMPVTLILKFPPVKPEPLPTSE